MALYKCHYSTGQSTLPYFLIEKWLQNKIIQSSDVHDISKPAQCAPTPLPPLRSAWLKLQLNTKIVLNQLPTHHPPHKLFKGLYAQQEAGIWYKHPPKIRMKGLKFNYPLSHPIVNPFVYGGPKMNQNFSDGYISIITDKNLAGL